MFYSECECECEMQYMSIRSNNIKCLKRFVVLDGVVVNHSFDRWLSAVIPEMFQLDAASCHLFSSLPYLTVASQGFDAIGAPEGIEQVRNGKEYRLPTD